jgi:hypothetical protein
MAVAALSLSGCGKKEEAQEPEVVQVEPEAEVEEEEPVEEEEVAPEGMVRSELTNEWISEELADQRPIAVMVDNELYALPHYSLTQADVVYEMMNSLENGRITRLMALFKDWKDIEQIGSIRSTRTTNVMLAAEWNAILCHDGGPFYIDSYLSDPSIDHIDGSFARIDNGKSREYTEYVTKGEVETRLKNNNISETYNEYYQGPHFTFASEKEPVELTDDKDAVTAENVALPFPHNKSCLTYKEEDGLYYYSEYGDPHLDPANDNAQLCFKNVILQDCSYVELDENGYLTYNCIGTGDGYYLTNGQAVPITWEKEAMASPTHFYDADGNDIVLNTGKTYIALVPSDKWEELVLDQAEEETEETEEAE